MNKFLLFILLASCSCSYGQQTTGDTPWFVELTDSTILFSEKLLVKASRAEGEYLLLDDNRKIPMHLVRRYKNKSGEYIRLGTPPETYRLENEGPRLFIYSRKYYYEEEGFQKGGKDYFLWKENMPYMPEVNYKNLRQAMADNPYSVRELRYMRTAKITGYGLMAAAGLFTALGINAASGENDRKPIQHALGKGYFSPLMIAGTVTLAASITVFFMGSGRTQKAIRIYNQ